MVIMLSASPLTIILLFLSTSRNFLSRTNILVRVSYYLINNIIFSMDIEKSYTIVPIIKFGVVVVILI